MERWGSTERWVNGCESISSVMLLQAVGIPIDPDVFIERDLPHAPYWEQEGRLYGPDPMFVYPGDPHDHTGYGCYAPCIVQALQSALKLPSFRRVFRQTAAGRCPALHTLRGHAGGRMRAGLTVQLRIASAAQPAAAIRHAQKRHRRLG